MARSASGTAIETTCAVCQLPRTATSASHGGVGWYSGLADGRPALIGYDGGEKIYDSGGGIRIHLLTTADGWTWTPLVPGEGVVKVGGGSEADFAIAADGSLVAVVRNEAGELGPCHGKPDGVCFGSWICAAPATDWAAWSCRHDPRKYDSPLLVASGGTTWLIGRRTLGHDGHYDLAQPASAPKDVAIAYQIARWTAPKRCSLWRVDAAAREVSWVLDLPSAGDTCFASVLPIAGEPGAWTLYNYTSPPEDPAQRDIKWVEGQLGETRIYRLRLQL